MKEITGMLASFEKELDKNDAIVKKQFEAINPPAEASLIEVQKELGTIEPTVLDFYETLNGIVIKWNAADKKMLANEMTGSVKVNSFLNVVKDWSGVVYFGKEPEDSPILEFFPLDFFADEAAVGFCTMEGWGSMMYLYRFDNELIPLQVDFHSYLELLIKAKGTFYWQYLILEILQKKENEVSKRIKKYLPQLFPDFSFAAFEQLFDKLKIK